MGDGGYRLEDQVGHLMRRAQQRHLVLFAGVIPELTTTQFAALAKLAERGPLSQNQLGRATAMDAATIKGVVGRLVTRGLVATTPDVEDRRRLVIALTAEGRALHDRVVGQALEASRLTLEPLEPDERAAFLRLLRKLA
ncbi:MAG TPA: MarR family transcriptional regulator [Amaricoccus sp.]|nr:MarR family transcriptional regulator [Amaricoccus sp.]